MACNVGDRVGAILEAKNGVVKLLGFGVYEGFKVPHKMNVGALGMLARSNVANPCIRLDSGNVVWGCECWWGSEAAIQKELATGRFAGMLVEQVDIVSLRGCGSRAAGDPADPEDIPSL